MPGRNRRKTANGQPKATTTRTRAVSATVAMTRSVMPVRPRMLPSRPDGLAVRLQGTEAYAEMKVGVTGSTGTRYAFYPTDPGMGWLSTVAKAYSAFRVHRLRFYYVPICPTSQQGYVTMGWFRDTNDANNWNPTPSPITLAQTTKAMMSPIWSQNEVVLTERDLHQGRPSFEISAAAGIVSQDQSPGAIAWFGNAAPAPAATTTYGFVWVDYDISLFNPVAPTINVSMNQNGGDSGPDPGRPGGSTDVPGYPWPGRGDTPTSAGSVQPLGSNPVVAAEPDGGENMRYMCTFLT